MIQFNKSYFWEKQIDYIREAVSNNKVSGDGQFTRLCNAWIEENTGTGKALLTTSCSTALEMAALLLDIKPGDEVIMPSYTFVSTANAFVMRGATVVFVDIRPDTQNINEQLIEEAITDRTKAIVPVHYLQEMQNKLWNLAQKVLVSAVQNICSSIKTESSQ